MGERSDAAVLEIVGGELAEHLARDPIFHEGGRVLAEAEAFEPGGEVKGFGRTHQGKGSGG